MGAVLFGAGFSRQYRTKDIRLTDSTLFGVDAVFDAVINPGLDRLHLFPIGAPLGSTEILNLTASNDFALTLVDAVEAGHELLSVNLTGITRALVNASEADVAGAKVMLTFTLTESGVVTVPSAKLIWPGAESDGEGGKAGA